MSFKEEFPDFDPADMPAIPAGFDDVSWHNDMCPSFLNERAGLIIFVDYAEPAKREFPECPRFSVATWDNGACETTMDSEEWADVLAHVRSALAAEYVARIGYNPFEDNPAETIESVNQTLSEYVAEVARDAEESSE